uniref:Uncharacterized protein n=1 Tax=Oryza meridionalis TaxID=40149 RepID=A0A0E0C4G6_9ORYZ
MASNGASGEVRYGVARAEDDATARPSATAATAFASPRGARSSPSPTITTPPCMPNHRSQIIS